MGQPASMEVERGEVKLQEISEYAALDLAGP
jgi:hypothetical protein